MKESNPSPIVVVDETLCNADDRILKNTTINNFDVKALIQKTRLVQGRFQCSKYASHLITR